MSFIEILKAILFGIVEGITEWLPVSSTGHMIILDEFIKLDVTPEFYKMFQVVIQLGAILAVILIFWNKLWPFARKNVKVNRSNSGTGSKFDIKKKVIWKPGSLEMWIKIIIACVPAAVIGVLFDDVFDELFYHPVPVAIALIVVGIAFIIVESTVGKKKARVRRLDDITYLDAILIGLFQVIAAVFPGTSRSGATIVGAILIGVARPVAAEFTFFLAVPVMLGASLLKTLKFVASGIAVSGGELGILAIGTVVAFLVSIVVIKFLMGYIKKHDFKIFAFYRIILGILVILILR